MTDTNELDVFKPLKAEITATVAPTLQIAVVDAETSASAIEAAKVIKELRKRLGDKRKEITDPIRKELDEIMAYEKDIAEPLVQAENHIRAQLNAFAAAQEKRRQEEMRKAEELRRQEEAALKAKQEAERLEAIEAAKLFGEDEAAVEQEIAEKHQAEKVTAIVEHKARVFDAKETGITNTTRTPILKVVDLNQVPREWLILNEKAALAALRNGMKIPGLDIDYEISVKIGRNTRVGSRV